MWLDAGPEDGLAEDESRRVVLDGDPVLIVRTGGRLLAVEGRCSHEDKGLEGGCLAGEGEWECPHHGARFDLATGRATGMPAVAPIRTYPVRVADGRVQVDVE